MMLRRCRRRRKNFLFFACDIRKGHHVCGCKAEAMCRPQIMFRPESPQERKRMHLQITFGSKATNGALDCDPSFVPQNLQSKWSEFTPQICILESPSLFSVWPFAARDLRNLEPLDQSETRRFK